MKFPREEERDTEGEEENRYRDRGEVKEMNKQKFRVHFTGV